MLPLILQSPKAAISASAFGSVSVYCLYRAFYHLSSVSLDDNTALCGSGSNWDFSLNNDCFRTGFLWPAFLLLFGCVSAFSFCLCLVLSVKSESRFTSDGSSPFSRLSVGSMLVPVRRPPGHTIVVDNRLRIGTCTVILLAIQTALFFIWNLSSEVTKVNGSKDYLYSSAMAQLSAVVFLFSFICLILLWRSNRMTYAGLFPSVLPVAVGLQLTSGLCEVYFSFFTDTNANAPIIGADASARSSLLALTTIISLAILLLFSMAQWRPIFYRSLENTQRGPLDISYTSLAEGDNNVLYDDSTPLAHMSDQKECELVDTPEQNSSWFDTLTFSWSGELLKRGTIRALNYSDLYSLRPVDMPIPNWSRYLRYRKPGRSLLASLSLTYAPELIIQFVLIITRSLLRYASPFFLQRILRSIEFSQQGLSLQNVRGRYLDVLGLFFSTLLSAFLFNQSLWIGRQLCIRLKGLLVAELTAKTLRRRGKGVPDKDKKSKSKKESSAATDGKVMNILTADFQTVIDVVSFVDNIYTPPFLLAIGIWYMYKLLGTSALIGLIVTILSAPVSKMLFAQSRKYKAMQSAASDKRIATISEVLHGIKVVKLFGWETRFLEKVDKHREKQLSYAWKVFIWVTSISVSAYLNPIIILVIMFTSYVVVFGNTLNAEIAFTSIVVFQMVSGAIKRLPKYINVAIGGYVSISRIDSYLEQPQIQDLEKRTPTQVFNNELGFSCADLEWTTSDSPKIVESANNSDGYNELRRINSTVNTQPMENTPLMAKIPRRQTTLSLRSSATRIANQNDIMRFSLRDIDVKFPLGGLSIVAGPTGSGKSSLLTALVGEMTLVRGRVLLPTIHPNVLAENNTKYRNVIELSNEGTTIHDIAYVAQEAWLRNATIRENILFGEPYDRERYEEVLRVCALKPDLRVLVAGDRTEVGEHGIILSGGQKQRISLARAVYSSRRILLIDDCLSAVDAHTAKHILVECLAGNTKLTHGRTRVLVTHHVAMCLPYAQYIVMINEGRIRLKGTPSELKNKSALSLALMESLSNANALKSNNQDDGCDSGPSTENNMLLSPTKRKNMKFLDAVNDRKPEDEYNNEHLRRLAEIQGINPNSDLSVLQGILVKEEEREEGHVKYEVWETFIRTSGGKMLWAYLILVLVIDEAITALRSYWIKLWVGSADSAASGLGLLSNGSFFFMSSSTPAYPLGSTAQLLLHPQQIPGPHGDVTANSKFISGHHSSLFWLGIYTVLGFISVAWLVLLRYSMFTGRITMARKLHRQLIGKVIHAVPRFHETTPVGRTINRFSRDMDIIDNKALDDIMDWFSKIVSVLAIYFIISAAIPTFAIAAIITTCVFAVIAFYYLNTSRELKRLESNSMSPLLSLFGEIIQGATTIRAFGVKHHYIKEAINRISAHNRPFYGVWSANRWLHVRINVAGAMVAAIAATFILLNLDWINAGMAGFILSYAITFSEEMIAVVRDYSDNEMNINAIERIRQYQNIEQDADLKANHENKPPAAWPSKGDVQIEDLVVEYVPGVPVLRGISLSVKHGENVGVVGRTGAGKSTISLALMRFIEASKGRIVMDGVDISKIGLEDLRRNVTIIPQDPVLFNGTIRFNLDPFDEHPDELLWDALRRTHLAREDDTQPNSSATSVIEIASSIDSNEHGVERMAGIFTSLDTKIKENGKSLSSGQRQLMALARALVRRSKVIIMDEATASVDFDTDNRIQRAIHGPEFANSTLFCIAHRLRTIVDYDKVLVLENGKVAEFDTPHNLLQNKSGIFWSMCKESGEYKHLAGLAASRNNSTNGLFSH